MKYKKKRGIELERGKIEKERNRAIHTKCIKKKTEINAHIKQIKTYRPNNNIKQNNINKDRILTEIHT